MEEEFVTVKGKKYYVKDGTLNLSELRITDIDEIKGLENLTNLQELYLCENFITEIKGLENFTSLKELDLYSNKIEEIKGLDHLTNLRALYLSKNQISELKGLDNLTSLIRVNLYLNRIGEDEYHLLKKGFDFQAAQEVVKYCREKVSMQKSNS